MVKFFYVLNVNTIKKLILIIFIAFFTAWGLFISNIVYTPVFKTSVGPKAFYTGKKDLALTFNIGWGDEKAETILEVLKEQNVKSATFFLSGAWAEYHPDIVKQIKDEGYEIGLLGYEYKDYIEMDEAEIRRDILKAKDALEKLQMKDIKIMRAPTGNFDKKALKVADQLGLTLVHWSVDSKDWTNPGVKQIVENIKKVKKGDIVLFHASDSAKQTAAALPSIIEYTNNKHLSLVTVTEMIANAEAKTREVQ